MLSQIFKAYDVRNTYPDKVNENVAWKIGLATGQFLQNHPERPQGQAGKTVLISRDMRTSSPSLAQALSNGLRASGMNVVDLGMCDTSIIYFAVNHLGAAGGIQTTASHNPPQYNGFKISGPLAKPIGATTGLKDIQAIAETLGEKDSLPPTGSYQQRDVWPAYREHILSFLTPPKRKLKVFIDASNGMAGKMIPIVFDNIPNLEIIPTNFETTGSFVHEPNPLVPKNMEPTQQGVREQQCNLGACFDGDADRCMITDEKGETIGCDILTALLCEHFLKQAPKATVIYDLRASKVVQETIEALGGKPNKSRVGHVFMKALLRETDGIFGGELSGHFYFKNNYFADSGAIAFAAVISVLGQSDQTLSELAAPFKKYPQSGEQNYCTEDKQAVLDALKQKYADQQIDELDGVSIDAFATQGWCFNVRASNTEPLLRLNAEARDEPTLDALLKEITPMLGKLELGH